MTFPSRGGITNIAAPPQKKRKKKKDVQLESCELSFAWGKMRTTGREAASHIALRDCSKVAVGEGQYIRFCFQYHEALILQKGFINHEDLMSP